MTTIMDRVLRSRARSILALSAIVALLSGRPGPAEASTLFLQRTDSLPGRVVDVKAGEFYFLAPDTIPEGLTTFRLRQVGLVVDRLRAGATGRHMVADKGDDTRGAHMLWVVRLDSGKTMSDLYRAAQSGERRTPWAKQLGGPSFALPPRTSNVTLDLEPGNYVLVCYVGSAREDRSRYHFLNGMSRSLTVVRTGKKDGPVLRPTVTAHIKGDGIVHFSGRIIRGRNLIRVENATQKDYEFKFQQVPAGMTGKEFLAQKAGGPGKPWGGLASVPSGSSILTTIAFEPAQYILGTRPAIRHETSQVIVVAR